MTEYDRGFIDGIKSKVSAELTPTLINVSKTMLEMLKPVLSTALENALNDNNAITDTDVQPVKQGKWITKAEDYYKAWQDSGRSWDDMPYFVTGLKFACSNCFEQFDVNAEGVEKWNGCPPCLARMDGDKR